MLSVPSLAEWTPDGVPSAVTIGMFDGVHLGHQALLKALVKQARHQNLRSVAITFDHHPRLAVSGETGLGTITPLDEKLELLARLGIDLTAVVPVASGLLSLEAQSFARRFLVDALKARLIVLGYDFRFGRDRAGDIHLLRKLGQETGFEVEAAPVVKIDGEPVKSTLIRQSLLAGDMNRAALLLGRPYEVRGQVVHGERVGRKLGFPTANVRHDPDKLLPMHGIYAGVAALEDGTWPAAVSLGTRPSVGGTEQALEAYLLGFSGDLYGKIIRLQFGDRLRDQERYETLEALKEQIRRDVQHVSRWYANGRSRVGQQVSSTMDGWSGPDDPFHVAPGIDRQGGESGPRSGH